MQLRRQAALGVADVNADADNGTFQLAGFQAHFSLGEDAAALFSVQIEVVDPFDLGVGAVQGINGSGSSHRSTGSEHRRFLEGDCLL